jgi:hypothetical protein
MVRPNANDQAAQVALHPALRFVVIVEIAVDRTLVEVGRVGDRQVRFPTKKET